MIVDNILNRITQNFGNGHEGIDIGFSVDENKNKVHSLQTGKVIQAIDGKDNQKGSKGTASYGNFIMIETNDYIVTYAHLQKGSVTVNIGDRVIQGEEIGIIGDSGNAYGRHLHIRIQKNGTIINPVPVIQDVINVSKPIENDRKPVENDPKPVENDPKPVEIKIGDTVIVNGIGYASSYGTGSQTGNFVNKQMKVIMIAKNRPYPYACNKNNDMNGVTGWFKDVRK